MNETNAVQRLPQELTPEAFAIIETLREKGVDADNAVNALLLALGQLVARHGPWTNEREAFEASVCSEPAFYVFKLAWRAQKRVQRPLIVGV